MIVKRKPLRWWERLYLPAILGGFKVTLRHFFRKKVTMQYPEEKWVVPEGYRGAPYLVKDQEGNTKCVSCQLCEFVCPPKAIRIIPPGPDGPPADRPNAEMAAKTGRGEGAGNVSGRKVVNDEFRMTKSERRTKPEARTRTLRRYVYCSLLIVDVGVLFCGCGAETKQGSQAFRHSLRQKDVQVTLLAVERRNVFVDPGASGHFASDPRVVPGLAVAY